MASIQLLRDYAGSRTNENRIWPGFYDEDDPGIYGLAAYLVETGHAVWVDAPPAPVVLPDAAVDSMVEFGTEASVIADETDEPPPAEDFEVLDEIEHNGRKIQRRKPKG